MESMALSQLLELSPSERAELAMVLWESLSEAERDRELPLVDEQLAELDRRWAEHVAHPETAIPWSVVRQKLLSRG